MLKSRLAYQTVSTSLYRDFRRRETLPSSPDLLWQIESGLARSITWTDKGKIVTLGLWGPGSIFGESLSLIRPYDVECITPLTAFMLPRDSGPYLESLLDRVSCMQQLYCIMQVKHAKSRLMEFLCWLARQFGRLEAEWYYFDLHLSHQIIAETIGLERVTVTRMLGGLEQEGLLERVSKTAFKISPAKSFLNP
ncbi:catabolite gene activator and regulatory subunit of cAMP-dependent protein kinase [Rubidibacter lacunae KORDI 51-2]|uniref:Catabolite gene activator and regulatory subunit of cAMP-dependent protein kinase n=1 Tax=Rubidibacter lacunae KORDI 51-2 TaxID=582515 RepID=U5DNW2_9CHRO|nr:Crp/Fnr family transcriptional regulator [Rubidibacter lacunae]ERN42294.1 catabolite gene activator and regulatory subunit of cAMP-dependent protein kinase [Rubidibacter lacunae KORDI 51-2]